MFPTHPRRRGLVSVFCALVCVPAVRAADGVDFNREVLPILSDACFRCHGPDAGTREADLRLDLREGLFRTKEEVTVVKPGKPEESELWLRVTSAHEDEVMPPRESNRQLKPAEVAVLKKWIQAGAPWGTHWAFAAPVRPAVPAVAGAGTAGHPIDAFVRARLAKAGLALAPEAEKGALLRRVALDLTGVPPTPAEVGAFVADKSPEAYERAVDRLLASPRYGERWAWDWLDIARYADTNGFQGDPERTMWPWRDWVVKALNANMPYDRFSIEQLAGDLLPDATKEQKLASGFNRNNMHNGEGGRIPEETRVENVFDRVETTATVWMGLTFTCCRCHDHKFDPISQKDYFALYDVFNQMSETGRIQGGGQVPPVMDMSTPAEQERLKEANAKLDALAKRVEAAELTKFPREEGKPVAESEVAKKLPGNLYATHAKVEPRRRNINGLLEALPHFKETEPDPEYAKLLQEHIAAVRARDNASARITRVMIMDELKEPRETFILNKGIYEAKTDVKVEGAVPELFARKSAEAGEAAAGPGERMNRLGLARWLVSAENPLAARVAVNRAWQAFFGTGFVKTAEDFGVQSEPPSHPELLDWLATEFVRTGWDVKGLHRLIVTSATYRQSARATPELVERDPENRLLARGSRFRLPSWMIRDQALFAAGLLNEERGGPSIRPYQPAGIREEATFGKKTYAQDHGAALYRRSLYVFWRRIVGPTTFFDAGARQVCTVKVPRTNTPLHALVTLNDPAYVEAARVMAQRVLAGVAESMSPGELDEARVDFAFRLATLRAPKAKEREVLLGRLGKLREQFAREPEAARQFAEAGEAARPAGIDAIEHAAWAGVCSLILNLDEVLSKE